MTHRSYIMLMELQVYFKQTFLIHQVPFYWYDMTINTQNNKHDVTIMLHWLTIIFHSMDDDIIKEWRKFPRHHHSRRHLYWIMIERHVQFYVIEMRARWRRKLSSQATRRVDWEKSVQLLTLAKVLLENKN